MTATVLAFPLARRFDYIRRQARWYCDQNHRSAEANLYHQMQVQRDTLLAKGVDGEAVEREVRALEVAIRNETRRLIFEPQVGA
jgi:hypothetical protein